MHRGDLVGSLEVEYRYFGTNQQPHPDVLASTSNPCRFQRMFSRCELLHSIPSVLYGLKNGGLKPRSKGIDLCLTHTRISVFENGNDNGKVHFRQIGIHRLCTQE
jgi:hypothetical protein